MPRKRRRRRPAHDYTKDNIQELLRGQPFFERLGKENKREAWESLRDELIPKWIIEHPGSRSDAWWIFDAPEPRRRRVDGKLHPFDDPEWQANNERIAAKRGTRLDWLEWVNQLNNGVPGVIGSREESLAKYETQAEYLHRHELMTPEELEAFQTVTPELLDSYLYE